jgi:O-antigen/teichoic acid export membrane protein
VNKKIQGMLFPLLDVALNGANFGYHVLLSYRLSLTAFGTVNVMFALLSFLMLVGVSFQTYVAKTVASKNFKSSELSQVMKWIKKIMIVLAGVLPLLGLAVSKWMSITYWSWLMIVLIFMVNLVVSANRGILQGRREFLRLNASFYKEVITKVSLTALMLYLWPNELVPLYALFLAFILTGLTDYGVTHGLLGAPKSQVASDKKKVKELTSIIGSNICLYGFTALPLLVVRLSLPDQTPYYAIASKFSQLFFHIGFSMTTVMIPVLSRLKRSPAYKKTLYLTAGSFIGLGLVGLYAYWVFAESIVSLIYSSTYLGASWMIYTEAIAYFFLVMSYLAIAVHIVEGHGHYMKWVGLAASLMLVLLVPGISTMKELLLIEGITFALLAITLWLTYILRRFRHAI